MIDLLILYTLLKRDFTMYGIHKRILEYFSPFTNPSFGAIKPALIRLEKKGCLTLTKNMSEGGKLSIFYSITPEGKKIFSELMKQNLSNNPLQFFSDVRIKLFCLNNFNDTSKKIDLLNELGTKAILHKISAQKILDNEYIDTDTTQKLILQNTISEYNNLTTLIENIKNEISE